MGGVRFLISQGYNGFLFEPGDAKALSEHLLTLARDPKLRKVLGQRLYEKGARDYSLEATVRRQQEIYDTILRYEKQGRDEIIICGAYGRGNAGDDAILLAILTELRAIDPDLSFRVLSRNPAETRMTYRVNAFYIFAFWKALYYFSRAKLFVNGGGSLMQDVTSYRSLWFYLWTLAAAKRHGCPVIMYGCGIGPINNRGNRRRTARVINRYVDAITLRDPDSRDELARLGIDQPSISLSADTTVILPPAPDEVVDGILNNAGIPLDGRYIGFILRPWYHYEEKVRAIAAAADHAYETHGLTPFFVPIEPRLDVPASQQVIRHMKAPHYILRESYSAEETIGVLSRLTVAVSMRLHGLVFSSGQGVPSVGIVYDQKVSSFLDYVGQDLYQDLDDLTEERLKEMIDKAVAKSGDRSFLTHRIQQLREMEEVNRRVIEDYLH